MAQPITSHDEDDEDPVVPPKATPKATFPQLPSVEESPHREESSVFGLSVTDEGLALQKMKDELLMKLSDHDKILNQILQKLGQGGLAQDLRGRGVKVVDFGLRQQSDDSACSKAVAGGSHEMPLMRPDAQEQEAHYEKKDAFARPTFTPALFSTFTQFELDKQEEAYAVDGAVSRVLYSQDAKTTSTQPRGTWVSRMVKHTFFDLFCAFVIITNSIFLGVEVELTIAQPESFQQGVHVIQYVYAAWFLLELILRVYVDGRGFFCGEDWLWGMLDVFVVMSSIWELAVDIVYALHQDGPGGVTSVSGLKALRIIRITRVIKVVRLMRVFKLLMAFRTLITSIVYTLKSLFWALMLLIVIVYVFAVLFSQAVNDFMIEAAADLSEKELAHCHAYFGSLSNTMLSLFMSISGGVSWEDVLLPLKAVSIVWVFVYLFYISFTYFAVLNVVTGVFCQSAIESAQNDHAAVVHSILRNKQAHVDKIYSLFSKLGAERTGVITFAMFEEKINSPAVREYFDILGLDVWDAWTFFKLLDLDEGGDVEIEEFLMGCLRLRGFAKAIDVGKIIHDQTWLIRSTGKFHSHVDEELTRLSGQMSQLLGLIQGV